MASEEERERATVYMEGLAQMRADWGDAEEGQEDGKRVRSQRAAGD